MPADRATRATRADRATSATPATPAAATAAVAVRRALLDWAPGGWRELPWRRTRDPWAVLVSELMLQQTQADRVVPKWHAFLARWPDPASCARDPLAEVVKAWSGLGYNRRALHLHRCAQVVVDRHGGRLPADLEGLLALPGVGPYTARAVLAFAFGRDVGVVDTNAARVLARAMGGRRLTAGEAQRIADELVPAGSAWRWNQAMLDLGATVCTSQPRCGICPLRDLCVWGGAGTDPAVGSSGVSTRQSRFNGSDRQGRGRLLEALRSGAVTDVAGACGWPDEPERAARVAAALVTEGFAVTAGGGLALR